MPKRRWEDDTKIELREVEWGGADWMHLAQENSTKQHINTFTDISLHKIVSIHCYYL
jgi:hypothetical protein